MWYSCKVRKKSINVVFHQKYGPQVLKVEQHVKLLYQLQFIICKFWPYWKPRSMDPLQTGSMVWGDKRV